MLFCLMLALYRKKWVLDSRSGNNVCIYERLIWWVHYEAKIPEELLGRLESNTWEKPCDLMISLPFMIGPKQRHGKKE